MFFPAFSTFFHVRNPSFRPGVGEWRSHPRCVAHGKTTLNFDEKERQAGHSPLVVILVISWGFSGGFMGLLMGISLPAIRSSKTNCWLAIQLGILASFIVVLTRKSGLMTWFFWWLMTWMRHQSLSPQDYPPARGGSKKSPMMLALFRVY